MYNLKFDLALLGEENVVYKDVNIDFNYGDIINIIGETGCGKSTFYKMLMGRVKPASGIISSTITNNAVVVSDYVSVPKEVLIKDIFVLWASVKFHTLSGYFLKYITIYLK